MATEDPTPSTEPAGRASRGPGHSPWHRLHRASALTGVGVLVAGNVAFGPDPVFGGFAILWLGAVLLARWRARVSTGITTFLALVATLFGSGMAFYVVAHPLAFYGSEGALFTLLALAGAVTVIAALGILLQRRAPWARTRVLPMAVAGIAGLAVVAATATGAAARSGLTNAQASPGDLRLDAKDTKYSTGSLTSGGEVTIYVTNSDSTYHTLTIDGVVDEQMTPHSSHRLTFKLPPGQYRYYCTVPGHADDMHGVLVVH